METLFYRGLTELIGTSHSSSLVPLCATEAFEIVCLRNPHRLTAQEKDALFQKTIVYTIRAFGEEMDKMTEEDRFQHFSHTLGGEGAVCLLGTATEDGGILLMAHANFVFIPVIGAEPCTVLYLNGICCDPKMQGSGLGTMLMKAALAELQHQAQYLVLRTMNLSVLKIMRVACKKGAKLYPVDHFEAEHRPDILQAAAAVATSLGWGDGVQADRLVMRRVYPPEAVSVFRGSPKTDMASSPLQIRVEELIDRDAGDALICVVDLG